MEAISNAPGMSLAARASGNYQRDQAKAQMAEIAAVHPDHDGVLVANDYMALGVIDALRAAEIEAAVVSINAMPEAIGALKSGDLLATAAFDAMLIACAATYAMDRVIKGLPVPDNVTLPVEIKTASNCDDLSSAYDKRPIPSWEELTGMMS